MTEALPDVVVDTIRYVIDQYIPAHRFLGITLHTLEQDRAVLALPYREELVGDPRTHRMHGGIIASLLDSAGGTAAMTTMTSHEDIISSIDFRVDFLNPAKPEDVLAEGKIIRNGKNVVFTTMRAWHKDSGESIAEGRGVYRVTRYGEESTAEAAESARKDLS